MTAPVTDTPIPDDELAASFGAEPVFLSPEPADDAPPPEAETPPEDAPPADSTTTPEPVTAEADQPPVDPFAPLLKDAKPLAYKVDGAERVFDSILDLGDKGGFIPPDKVQEVRNMVARYESNAEANRELYAFRQQVERMGGLEKYAEQQETNAALNKVGLLLLDALQNPERLIGFDAAGNPVRNEREIQLLVREMAIAQQQAKYEARSARSEQETKWTAEASESEVRQTAIPTAVHGLVQHFGLTAEDATAANAFFAPLADALLFKATPEQALQYGVAPGTLMVDRQKMAGWFQDRQAQRQSLAEQVKARTAAATENARRVPAKPVVAPKPKPVARAENGQFAERKRRDPSEYFEAALSGKPTPGTTDE